MQFASAAFHCSLIRILTEIANILPVWIVSTVSRDLALRHDAKKNIRMPFEHEKDMVALEGIRKEPGKYQTAQRQTNVNNLRSYR
jgi:hypothetical protein